MGRGRGVVGVIAAISACWMASCNSVDAPEEGILSISPLLLPSPGLVAGDTMRDSLGVAAPLRVIGYSTDGSEAQPQPPSTFVLLDTGAHLANGQYLVGEDANTTVRVVGSLASLQTQPASVKVTLSPDTLLAADSAVHTKTYTLSPDTLQPTSAELTTKVWHRDPTTPSGVEAVIVRYTIVQSPPPRPDAVGPTIVLMPGSSLASRDTTSTAGIASRAVRLRISAIGAPGSDTAVVDATASYRGQTIGTVQFIVVFRVQ
jgi:hypothetical protein